jgi:hypothetical protein
MIEKDIVDSDGEKTGRMFLLPPAADRCQTCAVAHEEAMPHNAHSLYYQTAFNMEHGRAATWLDAMEHCAEPVREAWIQALEERGIDVKGGGLYPPKK